MSRAEVLYQQHLDELRRLAEDKDVRFVDILMRVSGAYKNHGLDLHVDKSSTAEQIANVEQRLIDKYRVKRYEGVINDNLIVADALMLALKKDAEKYAKASKKIVPALKVRKVQTQNLELGRQKGSSINKKRADAVKGLAYQINKDLLAVADSARWNIKSRSKYIQQQLGSASIEVEGNRYKATMINGKKYSSETIRTWITGT